MNLKSLLKSLKLNESTISMLLGAIVIVVVGVLVVNYFRDIDTDNAVPTIETEITDEVILPTTHTVSKGEDLWTISEQYYKSGYNWVDIAEANELSSPGNITVGQELTIPNVDSKAIGDEFANATTEQAESTPTNTPEPTDGDEIFVDASEDSISEDHMTSDEEATTKDSTSVDADETEVSQEITGDSYTVVRGDSLWTIAQRAYGDGNRWIDIAEANELVNPSIIHSGNVFTLPR